MNASTPVQRETKESYRHVVARLASAQKSSKGAPAYSRFINRRLGRCFAAAFYLVGASPNFVTAVSGCTTAAGIVLIAALSPSVIGGVLIGLLLIVGYALDAADGQLARLQGRGSVSGEWLDHMVDSAKLSSIHIAVAIHWFRFGDVEPAWLLVPLGFTIVQAVLFFAQILNEQLLRNHSAVADSDAVGSDAPAPLLASLLKIPTDYGFLCILFLFFGVKLVFRAGYVTMFIASAAYLGLAAIKWYGQMNALSRG